MKVLKQDDSLIVCLTEKRENKVYLLKLIRKITIHRVLLVLVLGVTIKEYSYWYFQPTYIVCLLDPRPLPPSIALGAGSPALRQHHGPCYWQRIQQNQKLRFWVL